VREGEGEGGGEGKGRGGRGQFDTSVIVKSAAARWWTGLETGSLTRTWDAAGHSYTVRGKGGGGKNGDYEKEEEGNVQDEVYEREENKERKKVGRGGGVEQKWGE
jgi:hypothetical protein